VCHWAQALPNDPFIAGWPARRHGEHGLALVQMHGRRPAVGEDEVFAVFDWLDARGHLTLKAAADRIERKYGVRYSLANIHRLRVMWLAKFNVSVADQSAPCCQ
jgi:transposase